jgi:hypothetical protein
MELCEDIRHTFGMKELYQQRKETIERLFGTAKENHGFRYTQQYGKHCMEMKVGLTFACMNLKKLAKMKVKMGLIGTGSLPQNLCFYFEMMFKRKSALGCVS